MLEMGQKRFKICALISSHCWREQNILGRCCRYLLEKLQKQNKKNWYLNYKAFNLPCSPDWQKNGQWRLQQCKNFNVKNNCFQVLSMYISRSQAQPVFYAPLPQTWEVHTGNRRTKARVKAGSWQHATSAYVWAWHFPSPLHVRSIKHEENDGAVAEAHDSGENFPSLPVFERKRQ